MMKSIVTGLVALSVALVPVAAEARGRDHGGNRGGHRDRGSHIDTGEAIAIGLGALILGSVINGSRVDRGVDTYEDRYDERDYRYTRNCREVISSGYDRYGNYYEKRTIRC